MKANRIRYYLEVAKAVAKEAKCTRRKIGAILVKDDEIIATGYNGSVRGAMNCGIDIECAKDLGNEPHYQSYFTCPAIHAEVNVCISSGRKNALGSTMFLNTAEGFTHIGTPCEGCRRVMIQCGIKDIYFVHEDGSIGHEMIDDYIEMENDFMVETVKKIKDLKPTSVLIIDPTHRTLSYDTYAKTSISGKDDGNESVNDCNCGKC